MVVQVACRRKKLSRRVVTPAAPMVTLEKKEMKTRATKIHKKIN